MSTTFSNELTLMIQGKEVNLPMLKFPTSGRQAFFVHGGKNARYDIHHHGPLLRRRISESVSEDEVDALFAQRLSEADGLTPEVGIELIRINDSHLRDPENRSISVNARGRLSLLHGRHSPSWNFLYSLVKQKDQSVLKYLQSRYGFTGLQSLDALTNPSASHSQYFLYISCVHEFHNFPNGVWTLYVLGETQYLDSNEVALIC